MSVIPLDFQRRCEQRWAAKFLQPRPPRLDVRLKRNVKSPPLPPSRHISRRRSPEPPQRVDAISKAALLSMIVSPGYALHSSVTPKSTRFIGRITIRS